jgi:hypothetical protein
MLDDKVQNKLFPVNKTLKGISPLVVRNSLYSMRLSPFVLLQSEPHKKLITVDRVIFTVFQEAIIVDLTPIRIH